MASKYLQNTCIRNTVITKLTRVCISTRKLSGLREKMKDSDIQRLRHIEILGVTGDGDIILVHTEGY